VAWIRECLNRCDVEHLYCRESSDRHFVPKRVLDLTANPIRLVEFSANVLSPPEEPLRYAALSYCWGSAEDSSHQLKTEISSLPFRKSAIRDTEMTPLLRDAIQAARSLCIPYLWIDSLCIIQDDDVDWKTESAIKGRVLVMHTSLSVRCPPGPAFRDSFDASNAASPCLSFRRSVRRTAGRTHSDSREYGLATKTTIWRRHSTPSNKTRKAAHGFEGAGHFKRRHCPPGWYSLAQWQFICSALTQGRRKAIDGYRILSRLSNFEAHPWSLATDCFRFSLLYKPNPHHRTCEQPGWP